MARCKLTRMSLRNIRKDRQYQCIIIDLVRTGVISKSKAEELLNYTIPAGLLENSAYVPDDDDEPGTDGESGSGSEGGESGSGSTETTTLKVNIGTIYEDSGMWNLGQVYEQEANNPLEVEVKVPTDVVTRLNSAIRTAVIGKNIDVTSNADWLTFSTALSTAVNAAIENNPGIKTGLGFSSDANLTVMPLSSGDDFCLLEKNSNAVLVAYFDGSETDMYTNYDGASDPSGYTDFLNPNAVYVVNVNPTEE